ncbi:MAG: SIS domain-containing protein, partial [Actinomycetota bacterium]
MDERERIEGEYRVREGIVRSFFQAEAPRLADLCHVMARRFARGGRLIAFGAGAAATDAQHVSVEFVHPVIVGKRALPALALVNDSPSVLELALRDPSSFFVRHLEIVGRPEDMALGMVHHAGDTGLAPVAAALKHAGSTDALTIGLGAPGASLAAEAEHAFTVPSEDPFIVQEVHETLYHVLWELVHVFFDHKGLLEDRVRGASHDTGRSGFLYPFLAEAEANLDEVLVEITGSIRTKAEDVIAMRAASRDPSGLTETARLIAQRVAAGGKILAFGNGG